MTSPPQNSEHPKRDHGADWPALSAVQRWFHAVVTHPDGIEVGTESPTACEVVPLTRHELEVMVTRSERVSARDRIAIYANAYYARLLECLGEAYPALKWTLGDAVFNGFAFGYLQQHPSRTYTLSKLGEHFAEYLYQTRPGALEPTEYDNPPDQADWPDFLVDLARLEWTISEVFDGPGVEGKPPIPATALESLAPEDWPDLKINTAPCLRLLQTKFPLNGYYTAARDTSRAQRPAIPAPRHSFSAVSRRDFIVRRHDLTHVEFVMLQALQDGEKLSVAIDRATQCAERSQINLDAALQQSFQNWMGAHFFDSVTLPQREAAT